MMTPPNNRIVDGACTVTDEKKERFSVHRFPLRCR